VPAQKKIKQTDAIFAKLKVVNTAADQSGTVLRLSLDAKATVKLGGFSRGGKNRLPRQAADHDFKPDGVVNPFGILLPRGNDLTLYFTTSPITSDFVVDMLGRCWTQKRNQFPRVDTLVINQDNGPEVQSRRTQFLKRMVELAWTHGLLIRLAYYPPYHSKYNAIEHVWGVLEGHWSGDLLEDVDTVLGFAQTMTWNGKHPQVELVPEIYQKGIRLTAAAMKLVEQQVQRDPELGKWFLEIDGRQKRKTG
jgi:Rhodopirellula transposase DDE domain